MAILVNKNVFIFSMILLANSKIHLCFKCFYQVQIIILFRMKMSVIQGPYRRSPILLKAYFKRINITNQKDYCYQDISQLQHLANEK